MDPTPECASGNSSISVVLMTVALLDTKGLNVEGVALAGSRARGQERDTSDYDLLAITRTVRSIHIEDVRVDGHKVQLFLLPFRGIDAFLVLNCVSDNGIMAKMINGHVVAKGSALFTRIKTNLSTNLHGMEQIEHNSVNRNLARLRNRITKLLKDLNHSGSADEDLYTGSELFKTVGQFLLVQKARFFLPTEKHLYKELTKRCPTPQVEQLSEVYRRSVASADYSGLMAYCKEVMQEASQAHSSSRSVIDLKANLGCNVIFVASFDERLIQLVYGTLEDSHLQLVLNQDRDLLHPGVYFITEIPDFQEFLRAFKALSLSKREAELVTINYQLDYFLLEHFRRYNNEGLLVALSTYVMDNGMDRDIVMNSVLDWTLNSGIVIFNRAAFNKFVRMCQDLYVPSMQQRPETFDLNRVSERDEQLRSDLMDLDLLSMTERYRAAISSWVCADVADVSIRNRIVETHAATLPRTQLHSAFEDNATSFSNFYYLFESIFSATLLTHRERGLIYHSLLRILIGAGVWREDGATLEET